VSINRTNLRSEHGSERGARFRELNERGVGSDDPRRLAVASDVFPAANVEAEIWLQDDDIVIRLLADVVRRVATDERETRRGGGRGEPTREEVAAVFNDLVSRYRTTGSDRGRAR
jgi:hypothetical protein